MDELRSDPSLVFNIVVTNPSGYNIRTLNLPSYVELRNFPRDEYLKFLAKRPITRAFYADPRAWSMSLSEANALGGTSVIPKHSAFYEMYPREYTGLFDSKREAIVILKTLLGNISERQRLGELARSHQLTHFSNKVLARKLWEMIEELRVNCT